VCDAQVILAQLEGATDEIAALESAHHALNTAVDEVSELSQGLFESPGDGDIEAALSAAEDLVAARQFALEVAQDNLLSVSMEGFSAEQVQCLAAYCDSEMFKLPASFRILERTTEEWLIIEQALRVEQRCLRTGDALPDELEAALADIRSEPAVTAAEARLASDLDEMEMLFDVD
jgi:hypothetical protein